MWLEPLRTESAPPVVQTVYEKVRCAYGAVLDPIALLAHNPEALGAYMAFEQEIHKVRQLPKQLNHLVNLYVAKRLACSFCVDIGTMLAMEAGVTEAQRQQLGEYRQSEAFNAAERVALEYCDVMSSDDIEVSAELQGRLLQNFSTAAIIELTAIIAWEQFRSRFNRALGIEAHGFTASVIA